MTPSERTDEHTNNQHGRWKLHMHHNEIFRVVPLQRSFLDVTIGRNSFHLRRTTSLTLQVIQRTTAFLVFGHLLSQ